MEEENIVEIFAYLGELFGANPRCELEYTTDVQLLAAIIMSAQCTDKRVNAVTQTLFKKYKTAADFANLSQSELESQIFSVGFYRNKAKNIIAMANSVLHDHGGAVPKTMDELLSLNGVGRKTASVFLTEFYNIPAVAVDTHVMRLSKRLGLSNGTTPERIERDLKELFDKEHWGAYHHYLVLFGRYYCKAQKPCCSGCKLGKLCHVHR